MVSASETGARECHSEEHRAKKRKTMSAPLLLEDDEPIRISAIAECLHVSEKWVRRKINCGEMKSTKMGGFRVVLRRDFKEFWRKMCGDSEGQNV